MFEGGFPWSILSASLVLLIWAAWLLLYLWTKWLPEPYGAELVVPSSRTVSRKSFGRLEIPSKPKVTLSPIPEGGMSDGKLNKQTGVYRWAGGAILEDWNRPPNWFTESFLDLACNVIPEWLLDFYEQWANGDSFCINLNEVDYRINRINDDKQQRATRFALARLVRQPGFQWYPMTQAYVFTPIRREDYMDKSKLLEPVTPLGEPPATYADPTPTPDPFDQSEAIRRYLEGRAQPGMPMMDPVEAADTVRTLSKQYQEMAKQLMSKKENLDYQKAAEKLSTEQLESMIRSNLSNQQQQQVNELTTAVAQEKTSMSSPTIIYSNALGRPFGPDEYDNQTTTDKPLLRPPVNPRTDMSKLKPIPGIDTTQAANLKVRTPKNSSKAAWSSAVLRVLQSNLATYDAEVAQLFIGLTQVLSTAMRRPVTQDQLDFDVNFGSPIRNNERQLSVTVRKPTECRVAVTQTLQPNGIMSWDAEVWDMSGIPDGGKYKGRVREKIDPVNNENTRAATSQAAAVVEAPPPKKDPKRPRQVRI